MRVFTTSRGFTTTALTHAAMPAAAARRRRGTPSSVSIEDDRSRLALWRAGDRLAQDLERNRACIHHHPSTSLRRGRELACVRRPRIVAEWFVSESV
jgi:hypothetical protein